MPGLLRATSLVPPTFHAEMPETTSNTAPRGPYRQFTDPDGGEWLVWRLSESDVEELREPSSLGRTWLIFLGPDGETRRLAPAPTNWRRLKGAELYELAQSATPFKSDASP